MPPSATELFKLVHIDFKTYSEIGQIYGVDRTTVPYWLDKYDLPRASWKTSRYGGNPPTITDQQIRARYEAGESATAIAHSSGFKSKTTVLRILDALGVERRRGGWKATRNLRSINGTKVRSTYELRVANWFDRKQIPYEYEPLLPFGHHRSRADFLTNGWYIEVWGVHSKPEYAARKAWKQEQYQLRGLPLIELSPHHFNRDPHTLEKRLSLILESPQS